MLFTADDAASFWFAPWAAPLRSACEWLPEPTLPEPVPLPKPPDWLRPLCVQRMVGCAVAARAAWRKEHGSEVPYRFGKESEPCWTEVAIASYDRSCLRELSEEHVHWLLGMEVERLLRVVQVASVLVGVDTWTLAVLGICEHVSQVYAELKQRCKAMRARAIVCEELQRVLR